MALNNSNNKTATYRDRSSPRISNSLKFPFYTAVVLSVLCLGSLMALSIDNAKSATTIKSKFRAHMFTRMDKPAKKEPQQHIEWRKNARKEDFECLGWKQTGNCDPHNGPREPEFDRPCNVTIEAGLSGYCEVRNKITGAIHRTFETSCDGMKYGTEFKCEQSGDYLEYADLSLKYRYNHTSTPAPMTRSKRGIVFAVYPKVMKSAYAAIRNLRDMKCTLPIELWIRLDEMSTSDPILKLLNEKYNCHTRIIVDDEATGFYVKPYALYYSSFDQVLLLDADNFVVKDPEYLFDTPEFQDEGAIFWPDFWSARKTIFNIHNKSVVFDLLDIEYVNMFEQESGQVLIDKTKSSSALEVLMFYSFHLPRLIEELDMAWGDKDLFRFAYLKTNTSFHMIQTPPGSAGVKHVTYDLFCGHTMVQHDPKREIVFLHRNTYKLKGEADAPKIWDHIQQFKFDHDIVHYDVRGANGGEVFPDFRRCFGKDTAYGEHFSLTPLDKFPFRSIEANILKYANEAALIIDPNSKQPSTTSPLPTVTKAAMDRVPQE